MKQRPILGFLLFILLAYFITWATGLPVVLSTHADMVTIYGGQPVAHPIPIPFPLVITLLMIGGYGPALAAVIVTGLESGGSGVRELLRQFRRWRVPWIWFAIAVSIPILIRVLALGVTGLFGGSTPQHWFSWPSLFVLSAVAFGPWGEELGWRGFLQPRLQQSMGVLGASVLVGVVWHFWHYWTSATPAGMPLMNIALHFPSVVGPGLILNVSQSVLIAWLYNKTKGSLPIAWAFHAGIGLSNQIVAGTWPTSYYWQLVLYGVAVAVVIFFNRREYLSGPGSGSGPSPNKREGNVENRSISSYARSSRHARGCSRSPGPKLAPGKI